MHALSMIKERSIEDDAQDWANRVRVKSGLSTNDKERRPIIKKSYMKKATCFADGGKTRGNIGRTLCLGSMLVRTLRF